MPPRTHAQQGALEAGDQEFSDRVGQVLNQRSLIFLGEGAMGTKDQVLA